MKINYFLKFARQILPLLAFLIIGIQAQSQTLGAGDIAMIGYRTDSNDGFTFITLKDIPASEVIYFTDQGWSGSAWYVNSEDHLIWTAPGTGVNIGTVIQIEEAGSNNLQATLGSISFASGFSGWSMSSGDQIIAYQSTSGARPSSPIFITGIHGDDNFVHSTGCEDPVTKWFSPLGLCTPAGPSPLTGGVTSMLPTGLTNGVNAVALFPSPKTEVDNMKYTGTLIGSADAIRTSINDHTKWAGSDNGSLIPITSGDYGTITITPSVICTAPDIPTVTLTQPSTCPGSNVTLNISGNLNDATSWHIYTASCGGTQIGTSNGTTFTVSPTSNTSYFIRGEGACVTPGSCGSVTVNVFDITNPVISACVPSQEITVNTSCQATMPDYTGLITATDNCTAVPTIIQSPAAGTTLGLGTIVANITVRDASFNIANCTFNVTVKDDSNPFIMCIGNQTIMPNASCQASLPDYTGTALATDNCGTPSVTQSPAPGTILGAGTTLVTLTATDGSSNTANCSFNVVVPQDDASFSYSAASYCTGDVDPTPTITGLGGGSFSSTAGLSINGGTGNIDVSVSTPGTYTVTYTTTGTCSNSSSESVTVNALDNASFGYNAGTYCANGSDPTPTITGLGGGSFSSTAGLSLNSGSGAIDLSASTLGSYTVTYTTIGTCPNTSTIFVTVNALDDASFSYSTASYCTGDVDPTPIITGLGGGSFSSTAGLSISAASGNIDLSVSTPGIYTVTYTTTGTCPNTSSSSVTVNALDDASFSYSTAAYCVSGSDPTPSITGMPGGSFTSTPVGLSLNGASGLVDVSASTPGAYTISYTTTGTCPNTASISITINVLEDASFSYSAASYCTNNADPTPTITGLGGGSFTSVPAGLSINGATGNVDLSASTPGAYSITYSTTGACLNSTSVAVTINTADNAGFNYNAGTFCTNESDPTPTITGLGGGSFSSTTGLSLNGITGVIDLSTSTAGAYTVIYTTAGTCLNTSSVAVTVTTLDDASFGYNTASYCTNDSDPTPTITGLAGGTFTSSPAGLFLNASTGIIDVSASTTGSYDIMYTTVGACSNSATISVAINAVDDASFNYSAASFLTNEANPTPTISGDLGGLFSATPSGLNINTTTGEIELATSTAANYTISYTTSGVCASVETVSLAVIGTTPPTATIGINDGNLSIGETTVVTITFSETVTGFSNSDLSIFNGSLSNMTSLDGAITFTGIYTPNNDIEEVDNTIILDQSGVHNGNGIAGIGTTSSSVFSIDTKKPTATITIDNTDILIGDSATVIVTFSEAVSNFTNADIIVTNGNLSTLVSTDGNVTYTAVFTADDEVSQANNVISLLFTDIKDMAGNVGVGTEESNSFSINTVWEENDQDKDGVPNGEDAFPEDPTESVDADQDGIGANKDLDDNDSLIGLKPATIVPADAISPNGDGINDNWVVPGINNYPNSKVMVYNRNGQVVFEAKSYQNNWGGTYKSEGKLPTGSYYYVIDLGNGSEPLVGWIFINY